MAQGVRRQRQVGLAAEATDSVVDGPGGQPLPFSDRNGAGPSAPGSSGRPKSVSVYTAVGLSSCWPCAMDAAWGAG